MTIITLDRFSQMMKALETRCNLRHGLDAYTIELYYETVALKLSRDEIEQSFRTLWQKWAYNYLPSAETWLSYVLAAPTTNTEAYQVVSGPSRAIAALPPASCEQHPQIRRQNKLALIAGIFEAQGDTPEYREMLEGRGPFGPLMGQMTGDYARIVHEDVIAVIESHIPQGVSND